MSRRIAIVVMVGMVLGWKPLDAVMNPHPRVWLTPARIAAVQSRQKNNSPEWQAFNSVVSRYLSSCTSGNMVGVENALLMDSYALGYQVYRDSNPGLAQQYATCAANLLKWSLSYYTGATLLPDTFSGDGVTTRFTLSNGIYGWCDQSDGCSYGHPHSVTVNGAAKTVGKSGVDSGKDVYWSYGSAVLTFAVPPPAGAAIAVVHNRPLGDSAACPYGSGGSPLDPCPPLWSTNDFRNIGHKMAAVFDWIYPTLSATDKTFIARTLNAAAEGHLDTRVFYSYAKGGGALNNSCSGEISRIGLIGLATYGDNPSDDPSAQTNSLLTRFDKFFDGVVTSGSPESSIMDDVVYAFGQSQGRGGAMSEGPEYGPQDLQYYAEVFDAFLGANGTNYYTRVANFSSDVLNYTLWASSPGTHLVGGVQSYFPLPSEDEQPGSQLIFTESYRIYMLHLADYFGASTFGNYARFWLNNVQKDFKAGISCGAYCLWDLMYSNVASSSITDYREALGKDYLAAGAGRISARSDWSTDATWVGFFAGPQRQDHNHAEANSFFFYRKGTVLSAEEIGWGPEYVPSQLHNTLSLNGTRLDRWNGYPSAVFRADGDAAIVKYESDPSNRYMYAVGEAGQAYRSSVYNNPPAQDFANVQQFTREFVFLKPDFLVVYDRVHYQNQAAMSRAYFQFVTEPTVASNVITSTTGTQKVAVTSLLPAASAIGKIQNCQIGWLGGNVNEATCGPGISNCYPTSCTDRGAFHNWSAAVTSLAPSLSEQFLNIVQGMDATADVLPAETIQGVGVVAAHIQDPLQDKVVAFSTGATASFPVSYTFTQVGPSATHMIADLPPNTAVKVLVTSVGSQVTVKVDNASGALGDPAMTTTQGILFIGNPVRSVSAGPCDLNVDGTVNVSDVQLAANQARGATACGSADLNGDGRCDNTDLQRFVTASLGQGCKVGP